jgi:hypothetical protein
MPAGPRNEYSDALILQSVRIKVIGKYINVIIRIGLPFRDTAEHFISKNGR